MTERTTRTAAEWTSLVGSLVVLLVVVALIALQIPGDDDPAAPVARVAGVRPVRDAFHVDVTVHNAGDQTAANVQVSAELVVGGEVVTGDQTVDFLSADEEAELTFLFDQDPATGDLSISVSGFAAP